MATKKKPATATKSTSERDGLLQQHIIRALEPSHATKARQRARRQLCQELADASRLAADERYEASKRALEQFYQAVPHPIGGGAIRRLP